MHFSLSQHSLSTFFALIIAFTSVALPSLAEETPTAGVEVRNCVKLKSGKARLIDETIKKCKKNEKLVYLKFPSGFVAFPGAKGAGILSGKGAPKTELGNIGDFYLDSENYRLYGPKNETEIWGSGVSLVGPQGPAGFGGGGSRGPAGPQGETGATGAQGPAGITTLGYSGSFIDTTTPDPDVTTSSPMAIPIRTSLWNNKGVTITGGSGADQDAVVIANAGLYNIQFSTQLLNSTNSRRVISIWLAEKTPSGSWSQVNNSSTDMILGKDTTDERHVAAWNFFVNAQAGHMYRLMILADGAGVKIHSGASLIPQGGAGQPSAGTIPLIPGTILTVNQVG